MVYHAPKRKNPENNVYTYEIYPGKATPHHTMKLNFSGLALKWCYISKGILFSNTFG